jgi:FkbM family methyltransferase
MRLITRITQWIARFATSFEILGIFDTLKIFLVGRFSTKVISITLPNNLIFNFRGKVDTAVLSHFLIEGVYINDCGERRIKRIIDAGANIGAVTARFLVHYPDASLIAIEAEKSNYDMLVKNFQSRPNVKLVFGGIWPVKTNLKVIPGDSSPNLAKQAFRVVETVETKDTISAYTVSDLMQMMSWPEIDILKLDVEGAEHELFTKNYKEWVDKVKVVIFEAPDSDCPGCLQVIYRALDGLAFNSFICGESLVLIRSDLPWRLEKVIGFRDPRSVPA